MSMMYLKIMQINCLHLLCVVIIQIIAVFSYMHIHFQIIVKITFYLLVLFFCFFLFCIVLSKLRSMTVAVEWQHDIYVN